MMTYKEIKLLNGSECEIMMARGRDISVVCGLWSCREKINPEYKDLDMVPFLMSQLCFIDGERKGVDYYLELMYDDYAIIQAPLGELFNTLNINK